MNFTPKELPLGLRYDLHLHTQFSSDSQVDIRKITKYAKKKNLSGFAVTDHETLNGYKYLKKHTDGLLIVPGMEIETEIGEIMGLFISEEINTKLTDFFEIVDDIKDKNGLVVVPHPFDKLRSNHLKIEYLSDNEVKRSIQGVEIVNSRIIRKNNIYEAMEFQEYFEFFKTGGSDAHTLGEIGNGFTFIPVDDEKSNLTDDELKKMLIQKKSESYGKQSSWLVHAFTVSTKFKNRIF